MTLKLPKVYPITDRSISSLTHAEQVKRLIAGGATFIQLREKTDSPRAFFEDAISALGIARAAGVTLLINDRVDIALSLGADGVHLGQTDLPVIAARKLLGRAAIIGYSTHNIDQVKSALDLPIDYLAFGPIFETGSKENPDPVVGLEALREAKSIAAGLPIVAIGGIRRSTLLEVLSAGADSAAIISEILTTPENIHKNLQELMRVSAAQPR
jgi:thiamine-phosphate pyrophosphorylase